MIMRLFAVECKRALCNRRFAASILLMLLMEMLSSSMIFTDMWFGVDAILDNLFSGTGSATVLLMLFPLLPYAMSYARDMEEHALEFYMVRVDTAVFVAVRFAAAVFSAFLCVTVSFILFAGILLCMGHPLSGGVGNDASGGGYREFLCSNTILYLVSYGTDRGLSAAMAAASAVFLSVLYPHSLFTFTAPVCLYFLSLRLVFPREIERTWLIPDSWMDGVYESPAGGVATLLCKLGVAMLVCLVYEGLALILAKRRWHYA